MKILLILPVGSIHRYKTGNFKKSLRYAPLTLTTLASLIPLELEAEVQIVDEGIEILDENFDADLVGITSITGTAPRAYAIADRTRARGIPVVLGGVHPTLMPHEAAQHADAVVIGFAEESWPQLLYDFKQNKMKKLYSASPDVSLENLPFPRRDLLKKRSYITINTVQATRGCPHKCKFCVIPVAWGAKMYFRPVRDVIKEIEQLDGKEFLFLDPSPNEDVEYAKKLYRELAPLKKKWGGLSTIKIAEDDELLNLAVKSGCRGLLIGFEAVAQTSLDQIDKDFSSVNRYAQIVEKLHDNGIAVNGTFVFGADNEDKEVFARTVDFVDKAKIDLPRYAVLTPFPGTSLYKELKSQGRIIEDDWSLYDVEHVVFRPAQMSADELQEGLYWTWRQSYSFGSIFKRLSGSRCLLWLLIPTNLAYQYYAKTLPKYVKETIKKHEDNIY